MTVRMAEINDLEALTELFDLYRIFYEQTSDLESAKAFLSERFNNKESIVFIAEDRQTAVGFVQLYPSFSSVKMKRMWVLNDLYVREQARGQGYGEKLIKKAISYAKESGANGILLETAKDNLEAQKLYEKIGFKKELSYFYFYTI